MLRFCTNCGGGVMEIVVGNLWLGGSDWELWLFIFSIQWGVGAMNLVSQPHKGWGKLVIFDQQQITDMIRHMRILTCKKGDLACPNMDDWAVFGRGLGREQRGRG